MEQNLNFEYRGFKANGFVMLFAIIAVIAAGIRSEEHTSELQSR